MKYKTCFKITTFNHSEIHVPRSPEVVKDLNGRIYFGPGLDPGGRFPDPGFVAPELSF